MMIKTNKSSISQKVFITGASSGIGESLAHLLENKGYSLLLTGQNEEKLKSFGHPYFICDLSNVKERGELFRWAIDHEPTLWINNAGFGLYGAFDALSDDEIRAMLEVNLIALTESTHRALAYFLQRGGGTIVNVASMSACFPFPYGALYSATKSYVYQLTRSLDAENRTKGVRLLTSMPGVVNTSFQKRAARGKSIKKAPLSMDVEFAAGEIWKQIQSGKSVHLFDWRYRLLARLESFLPASLFERAITKALKRR